MAIDFASGEIQGGRDNQEDFHAMEELEAGGLLLALADGVGGESGGELASRAAVQGFVDSFVEDGEHDSERFSLALERANGEIAQLIDEAPGEEIVMATTLLALEVKRAELRWISVGDSPLLLFRRGKLRQLNEDHSGKAKLHGAGLSRNTLVSALTGGRIELIDAPDTPFPLKAGDLLLAATDGLWTLTISELAAHLREQVNATAAQITQNVIRLVEEKKKRTQDNLTVAVIRMGAEED